MAGTALTFSQQEVEDVGTSALCGREERPVPVNVECRDLSSSLEQDLTDLQVVVSDGFMEGRGSLVVGLVH